MKQHGLSDESKKEQIGAYCNDSWHLGVFLKKYFMWVGPFALKIGVKCAVEVDASGEEGGENEEATKTAAEAEQN